MIHDGDCESVTENDLKVLWHNHSGNIYDNERAQKLNSNVHPCFRSVIRLVWKTIISNGERGNICCPQLWYFWPLWPEGTSVPKSVDLFVQRCQDLVGEKCVIGMGGWFPC